MGRPVGVGGRMTEPWDLTEEQAEHAEKLLRRVEAGLLSIEDAALILRAAHPELKPPTDL